MKVEELINKIKKDNIGALFFTSIDSTGEELIGKRYDYFNNIPEKILKEDIAEIECDDVIVIHIYNDH